MTYEFKEFLDTYADRYDKMNGLETIDPKDIARIAEWFVDRAKEVSEIMYRVGLKYLKDHRGEPGLLLLEKDLNNHEFDRVEGVSEQYVTLSTTLNGSCHCHPNYYNTQQQIPTEALFKSDAEIRLDQQARIERLHATRRAQAEASQRDQKSRAEAIDRAKYEALKLRFERPHDE